MSDEAIRLSDIEENPVEFRYMCCGTNGPLVPLAEHDLTCPAIRAEAAQELMLDMVEKVNTKWCRMRDSIHSGSAPDATVWRELEDLYRFMHSAISESERLNNG